jgi:hypothetical protein
MSTTNYAPTLQALLEGAYSVRGKRETRCPIRGSALGACPRVLSAQMCGVSVRDFNARTMRIFEMGTARGRDLAHALRESMGYASVEAGPAIVDVRNANYDVELEYPVFVPTLLEGQEATDAYAAALARWGQRDLPLVCIDGKLLIRGRCDVALITRSSKPRGVHLLDFKTKSSYGFDKLDEEGPGHEYLVQAAAYAAGLRAQGLELLSVSIIFENKDTCELKAMPVDVDSRDVAERFTTAIVGVSQLLGALGRGDLSATMGAPVYAFEAGKRGGKLPWNCNYCSVGPIEGGCVPADKLVNKAKDGAIPKWEVRL